MIPKDAPTLTERVSRGENCIVYSTQIGTGKRNAILTAIPHEKHVVVICLKPLVGLWSEALRRHRLQGRVITQQYATRNSIWSRGHNLDVLIVEEPPKPHSKTSRGLCALSKQADQTIVVGIALPDPQEQLSNAAAILGTDLPHPYSTVI